MQEQLEAAAGEKAAEMIETERFLAVRQIVEGLPEGPIFKRKPIKNPKGLKVKPAEVYAAVGRPDDAAEVYWALHAQPRSAWTLPR